MNLNRVILIGRLAADPESRTTNTGQSVASIRVVTNRTWTDGSGQKQEQAEFHSVTLWGRLAEIANQYLKKGGLVMIEGRLQTRSWVGQDGQKRYRTEVVTENMQLGPKPASTQDFSNRSYGNGNFQSGPSQKFTSQKPAPQNLNRPVAAPKQEETEEEIPVINEDEPVRQDQDEPIIGDNEIDEAEVDLKDIPF